MHCAVFIEFLFFLKKLKDDSLKDGVIRVEATFALKNLQRPYDTFYVDILNQNFGEVEEGQPKPPKS